VTHTIKHPAVRKFWVLLYLLLVAAPQLCCSSFAALLQLCCSSVAALLQAYPCARHARVHSAQRCSRRTQQCLWRTEGTTPLYLILYSPLHSYYSVVLRCSLRKAACCGELGAPHIYLFTTIFTTTLMLLSSIKALASHSSMLRHPPQHAVAALLQLCCSSVAAASSGMLRRMPPGLH
jgi:hypothetical protein